MCSFLNATSFIYGYGHMAQKMGIGRSAVIRAHGTSELRIAGPAEKVY